MTETRAFTLLVFIALILAQASCSDRELKVTVTPTFSSIQTYTIQPKCLQCHASLATYSGMLTIVSPGNPSRSRLYEAVAEGDMPQYSPSLSPQEINAIYDWIQNGAPND